MTISDAGYVLALLGFLIVALAALAGHWVNSRGHRIFQEVSTDDAESFIHGLDVLTQVARWSGALLLAGSLFFLGGTILVVFG